MNMIFAFGLPSPGTAFLRALCSGHFTQRITSAAMSANSLCSCMVFAFRIFCLDVFISEYCRFKFG